MTPGRERLFAPERPERPERRLDPDNNSSNGGNPFKPAAIACETSPTIDRYPFRKILGSWQPRNAQ